MSFITGGGGRRLGRRSVPSGAEQSAVFQGSLVQARNLGIKDERGFAQEVNQQLLSTFGRSPNQIRADVAALFGVTNPLRVTNEGVFFAGPPLIRPSEPEQPVTEKFPIPKETGPEAIAQAAGKAAETVRTDIRRRRGRASTILTGPLGLTTPAPVRVKTLLGS